MNLSSIGFTASSLKNPETPLRSWYVSSSYTGGTQNGGLSTPWTGLSQVNTAGNNGTILAGDAILFKKGDTFFCSDVGSGCTFACGFKWWNFYGSTKPSGTASKYITFSSYGTGTTKPNFLYPISSAYVGGRVVFHFLNINYIIIDGLQFNDPRDPVVGIPYTAISYPGNPYTTKKIGEAITSMAIFLGESDSTCNNIIIRNCYMNNVGMGIAFHGNNNEIYNNVMENFGNVQAYNESGYAANPITSTGENNYIHNNYFKGAWAWSDEFGKDGGGCEFINTNINNRVMYNTFVDSVGIVEIGANTEEPEVSRGNIFAYNKIINCGSVSYISGSGTFAIDAYDNSFYNNVFIENANSRFSGPNFGSGFTQFPSFTGCVSGPPYTQATAPCIKPSTGFFNWKNGLSATTVWNISNNIVCLLNQPISFQENTETAPFSGSQVYSMAFLKRTDEQSKMNHNYNKFILSGGTLGCTLSANETTATTVSSIFIDTINQDPETWDFHTLSAYLGTSVDLALDFSGSPVTNPPYIGIFNT